jgi:hypothetical protein
MLFSVLHNFCSTAIYTIRRETGSVRWTLAATLLPLVIGLVVCFVVVQMWRIRASRLAVFRTSGRVQLAAEEMSPWQYIDGS